MTDARLAKPEQIFYAMKRSIDAAEAFTSYDLSGVSLTSDAITAREVMFAVPAQTNSAQWLQIQRAVEYAKRSGIRVTVTTAE